MDRFWTLFSKSGASMQQTMLRNTTLASRQADAPCTSDSTAIAAASMSEEKSKNQVVAYERGTWVFRIEPLYDIENCGLVLQNIVNGFASQHPHVKTSDGEGLHSIDYTTTKFDNKLQWIQAEMSDDPALHAEIKAKLPGVIYSEKLGKKYSFDRDHQVMSPESHHYESITPADAFVAGATPNHLYWHLQRVTSKKAVPDQNIIHNPFPLDAGAGIVVYVVDDGVDQSHSELKHVPFEQYYVGDSAGRYNQYTHGTSVASLICGRTIGVARGVNLVSVAMPVTGAGGVEFQDKDVIAAVTKVRDDIEAKNIWTKAVVNLSWGGLAIGVVEDIINSMVEKGVQIVAAAGNSAAHDYDACNTSPARLRSVIAVGAIDRQNREANFSQGGKCLDVFAPGVQVAAAKYGRVYRGVVGEGLEWKNGTSFAAPIVAALIACELTTNGHFRYDRLSSHFPRGVARLCSERTVTAFFDLNKFTGDKKVRGTEDEWY